MHVYFFSSSNVDNARMPTNIHMLILLLLKYITCRDGISLVMHIFIVYFTNKFDNVSVYMYYCYVATTAPNKRDKDTYMPIERERIHLISGAR
jgi:hypothetical protein